MLQELRRHVLSVLQCTTVQDLKCLQFALKALIQMKAMASVSHAQQALSAQEELRLHALLLSTACTVSTPAIPAQQATFVRMVLSLCLAVQTAYNLLMGILVQLARVANTLMEPARLAQLGTTAQINTQLLSYVLKELTAQQVRPVVQRALQGPSVHTAVHQLLPTLHVPLAFTAQARLLTRFRLLQSSPALLVICSTLKATTLHQTVSPAMQDFTAQKAPGAKRSSCVLQGITAPQHLVPRPSAQMAHTTLIGEPRALATA
mmetsp:Transcript_25594/g.44668  ORF Transcript_25594/g.44668 Transcript_25594/m.44668 type:complete len:262 (-) Transcript_25594:9130-9915(-)